MGKPVFDNKGFRIGKIKELFVVPDICDAFPPCEHGYPEVCGIVCNNKYIPWTRIVKFDPFPVLNVRGFELTPEMIPKNAIGISYRLLDEQLVDLSDKKIGRADDIVLSYDINANVMKIVGIFTGILLRTGLDQFHDFIPWTAVRAIRDDPPTAIVLQLAAKRLTEASLTDKLLVTITTEKNH
jgi:sporulation protein YlmC with PRC-barrel domain